jgi:DNA-binding NtrC family response regulator
MSSIPFAMGFSPLISDGRRSPSAMPAWTRDLFNQTPSLGGLLEPLIQATRGDMTVLITGETGTGKTHLAGVIHDHSRRKDQRLLTISCRTLSPQKRASELFGHVRGAFPGADQDQPGRLGAAGQGTVLLEDVDALALEQQAQLLHTLETGEYLPVGGTQPRLCRARVIASSKLDLEEAMRGGRFRQDLYYRLRVVALPLPPLRERPEDIGPLVYSMLGHFARELKKEAMSLSLAALTVLQAFPWPGNIRQLRNVIQRAVRAGNGPELLKQYLPLAFRE